MIMSNFIDEAERHAELYNAYTPRQRLILEVVEDSRLNVSNDKEINPKLNAAGVSESEINWLQRTGHIYLG